MIRILDVKDFDTDPVKYYEIAGLSTDTKPTVNVATGSVFIEVDTGDVFLYDEVSQHWNKLGDNSHDDGEDEDEDEEDEGMVVDMSYHNEDPNNAYWESEMNADDIAAAFISGKNVIFHLEPATGFTSVDYYMKMVEYAPADEDNDRPMFIGIVNEGSVVYIANATYADISEVSVDNGKVRIWKYVD